MGVRHRHGQLGETMARAFLEILGYRCLEERYRIPGGEIDLIMARGKSVAFVEVKTRQKSGLATAEECVHPRQLARLRRAAWHWLEATGRAGSWNSLDVVTIEMDDRREEARLRLFRGVG